MPHKAILISFDVTALLIVLIWMRGLSLQITICEGNLQFCRLFSTVTAPHLLGIYTSVPAIRLSSGQWPTQKWHKEGNPGFIKGEIKQASPGVKCLRVATLNLNEFSNMDSADSAHKAKPACANHGGCQIPSELAWPLTVNSNNRHITKFLSISCSL